MADIEAPTLVPDVATTESSQSADISLEGLHTDEGVIQKAQPKQDASKPEPKPDAPKPEAKVDPKPEPKPAPAKQPEAGKVDPKPDAKDGTQKPTKTAWQLVREREKELAEIRSKHEQVERELNELKSKPPTPADDPEKKRLATRLEELEQEIRYVNYEKSTEFKEKFQQPYNDKAKALTAEAQELIVETESGARNLTPQEFWGVVSAPSVNEAVMAAKALFPDDPTKANLVLGWRKEITGAWKAMEQAKAEYKVKGAEREKEMALKKEQERTQTETQKKQADEARMMKWREANEVAFKNETLKDLFQAAEDDSKGKELLTKGLKAADRAFGVGDRDAEGNLLGDDGKPLDEDSLIALHSGVRNKAGAFNYVAYKLRSSVAKIAELEKQLEQYKKSEPGVGSAPSDKKETKGGAFSDLDELDKLGS